MKKQLQNATRKISGDRYPRPVVNETSGLIEIKEGYPDTISFWIAAYFRFEVTTSESSQKVQRRDLVLFRDFLITETGSEERTLWTPRQSRAFKNRLKKKSPVQGQPALSGRAFQLYQGEDGAHGFGRLPSVPEGRTAGSESTPWASAQAATSACVANQTSPHSFAMRMSSSRIQIRER